jgi:hypothetical protein
MDIGMHTAAKRQYRPSAITKKPYNPPRLSAYKLSDEQIQVLRNSTDPMAELVKIHQAPTGELR